MMFYLAAGDSEEGFWVQLLVIVLLAAGVGVYGVAKSRAKKQAGPPSARPRQQAGGGLKEFYSRFVSAARSIATRKPVSILHTHTNIENRASRNEHQDRPFFAPNQEQFRATPVRDALRRKGKDLKSGMELLAKDFLAGVVEQTGEVGRQDIEIRRLCFNELIRRDELGVLSSDALKVYILDERGFYGKVIQCAAMKELAGRTGKTPQDTAEQTTVNAYGEIDG
jgi:hypothetical protein